jgi:hypothetical protein
VVGAKDERHGVEQEDGRFGMICHGYEFISSQFSTVGFGVSLVPKSRTGASIVRSRLRNEPQVKGFELKSRSCWNNHHVISHIARRVLE